MIILAGTLTYDPSDLPAFADAVAAMRQHVLGEEGCKHYSLLIEDAATGLVSVCEIWEDDAALHRHFTQPWIADFVARFGPRMRGSTVMIHDVAGVRPLPGR